MSPGLCFAAFSEDSNKRRLKKCRILCQICGSCVEPTTTLNFNKTNTLRIKQYDNSISSDNTVMAAQHQQQQKRNNVNIVDQNGIGNVATTNKLTIPIMLTSKLKRKLECKTAT